MFEIFSFYLVFCIKLKYLTLHSTHLCRWGDMEGNYIGTNCVFTVFSCVFISLDMS